MVRKVPAQVRTRLINMRDTYGEYSKTLDCDVSKVHFVMLHFIAPVCLRSSCEGAFIGLDIGHDD